MTTLYIKNMVCDRCKLVVRQELEKLGLQATRIALGEVDLSNPLTKEQSDQLDDALVMVGFERIDDRKSRLVERIRSKVIEKIHHVDQVDRKFNWSAILSEELHYDYDYLSGLFSDVEGITLEQFIIGQKIERVKELLSYDELNLSQIANKLGYSSVAHLSSQFKKVTGDTPSNFKRLRDGSLRNSLDHR